tara:strand:- start:172 stop:450 length:279 start_codon:yes stop_codon:yes gene_type:complete
MLPLWTGLTLLSAASAMPKMRNHSPCTYYLVELSDFNEFPKSTEPNRSSDDCFFKTLNKDSCRQDVLPNKMVMLDPRKSSMQTPREIYESLK